MASPFDPPRRRRLAVIALLVAVLGTSLPIAHAHVGDAPSGLELTLGNVSAYLEPSPTPVYANATTTWRALLTDLQSGTVRGGDVTLNITDPAGQSRTLKLVDDGQGYHTASSGFAAPGSYHVQLTMAYGGSNLSSEIAPLAVYRDLPYRVRAVDQALDIEQDERVALVFEVVDRVRLTRTTPFEALSVQLDVDNATTGERLDSRSLVLEHTPADTWRTDYTFALAGRYTFRFFTPDGSLALADLPALSIEVFPASPDNSEPAPRDTPGPAAFLALVSLASAALAARSGRRPS